MAIIFKDFDLETLIKKIQNNALISKSVDFVKTNKLFVRIVSVCLVIVLSLIVTIVSVGITVGFDVKYAGKIIATVQDASVFEAAKNIAISNISSDGAYTAIASPKYCMTITVTDKLDGANKVADAIIENTDGFVSGSSLIVNGETVVCVTDKDLAQKVENRRKSFYIDGAVNQAEFIDDVKVSNGYYLKKDVKDTAVADEYIGRLEVSTVSEVSTTVMVDYNTKEVKSNELPLGQVQVTQKGKKGVNRRTETVTTVNGMETSREFVSENVVSEPTEKILTVGTAPIRVAGNKTANASSSGLICPINAGEYKISSYYGDGRGHKGWDLAADKGVSIFAAAGGTVVYAGYDSDYGFNVIIDHGNGLKTRYAHASALCVSNGQTVAQGKMIATVGCTGRSTGNHLHFEVILNETRVDPAKYIG